MKILQIYVTITPGIRNHRASPEDSNSLHAVLEITESPIKFLQGERNQN